MRIHPDQRDLCIPDNVTRLNSRVILKEKTGYIIMVQVFLLGPIERIMS